MDRAHRIGQKKVVNVYRLITRGTIEEKIMSLQKFKLHTAKTVISSDNADMTSMEVDIVFCPLPPHLPRPRGCWTCSHWPLPPQSRDRRRQEAEPGHSWTRCLNCGRRASMRRSMTWTPSSGGSNLPSVPDMSCLSGKSPQNTLPCRVRSAS